MKRALKWLAYVLGGLVLLLAIVIAGGYFYFAATIDQYTPRIERIASERLGEPVEIGSIGLGWHGFGIEVELRDVAALDPDSGRSLVSADRVRVDLNPLSFASWPAVYPALVGVDGAKITIERLPDGRLMIPGLPSGDGPPPTPDEIVTVLSRIGTIAINDATITFNAPQNGVKDWQFHNLDARVDGPADAPQVVLSADLPDALGHRFSAQLHLNRAQPASGQWRWQGQATLAALKLDALPMLAPSLPIDPHGGRVNVTFSGTGVSLQPQAVYGQVRPLDAASDTASVVKADLNWRQAAGGTLALSAGNMDIVFHGLFRGPIPLDHAELPLTFKHEPDGWRIATDEFALGNSQLTTSGHFSVLLPDDGGAPRLDVQAQASGINLEYKSRYLPVGIMPADVTAWVDRSVKSGRVPRVEVVFRGAADKFPFRHGEGLFRVNFDLRDARIKFDPEWPAVEGLDAEIEFKNEGLLATVIGGNINGMSIAGTTAKIADLSEGHLAIEGDAVGDAAEALAFLRESPIAKKFGPYITETKANGKLDVDVQLSLPLSDVDQFQVRGEAHLKGVDVTLAGLSSGFDNLTGQLNFTNGGLSSPTGLEGQFLNAPVAISVKPAPGDSNTTLIGLDGSATAAALTQALDMPQAHLADGRFDWHAQVELPNELGTDSAEPLTLAVHSDLKGLALNLPAPFHKPAATAVETTAHFAILSDGFAIDARYGNAAQADIQLADTDHGTALAAGEIHFGAGTLHVPDQGLLIDGHLARVSLTEWQQLAGLIGSGSSTAAPPRLNMDLTIGQVDALGQHFRNVKVNASSDNAGYVLKLAGPDIAGTIELPTAVDNKHPYDVVLDHLHLDANFAEGHAKALELSPTTLPPLKFSSRETTLGERHLGTLEFQLLQAPGGVVVPRFSITQPALEVNMYGTWVLDDEGVQHTRIAASARSDNIADAFRALGLPPAITAQQASVDAELHWTGPPTSDIVKRLGGAFTIHLKDGRLPEVSPGAGRLLALLSLNALPRRLLFNFSDVFSKGFSYDSMGGTFTIASGNAYTNDFRLESTVADVRVVGRIGLAKQDYDEVVLINTSISSTLPVAGAIAGGPITGAALLLLTQIFKSPLKEATQIAYHITGPWDNPQMKPIAGLPEKGKAQQGGGK
ncbi:MAG TPA: YhdP family protein [Gammaproteobacteria bacterium]|nr:YhdP family protein [Gammaproteobacteria bacterium]